MDNKDNNLNNTNLEPDVTEVSEQDQQPEIDDAEQSPQQGDAVWLYSVCCWRFWHYSQPVGSIIRWNSKRMI